MADFDFVHASAVSSDTNPVAFPADVTAGNLLVVHFSRDGGGSVPSVTDTQGNTWQRAVELDSGQHIETWWTIAGSTGACSVTVTFTPNNGNRRVGVAEYVGPAAGVEVGDTAALHNTSTTTPTSGAVTPTADGALIVGAITPTAVIVTPTEGGGFTLRPVSGVDGFASEDLKQTTAAAIAATWTINPADPANCLCVAFQALGAGTPDPDLTDLDTDEIITEGQTGASFACANAGANASERTLTLRQGATSVTQTQQTGDATGGTFDVVMGALMFGAVTARVTRTSDSAFGELAGTFNPATGELYVTLTSVHTTAAERITAIPDLVIGWQLWARGVGGGPAPAGLFLNADGTFGFTAGNTEQDFEVAAHDGTGYGAFAVQSVGGGVTGELTGTLADLSISAEGALDLAGALSGTLEGLGLSSGGELDITGALSGTLEALTADAAAQGGFTGSLSVTLDALTAAAEANNAIAGSLSGTLEAVTVSATAELDISGSLAATLSDASLSAAGTTVSGKTGAVQSTLEDLGFSAAGELALTGSLSGTLEDLVLTATGEFAGNRTGALSATLEGATLTAVGQLPIVGTVAVTLGDVTLTSGTLPPVPTPPGRTFVVEARNRTFTVPPRNRTYIARGATSGDSTFGSGQERSPRQYRVDDRSVSDSPDSDGRGAGELRGSGFRHGAVRDHLARGLDGRSRFRGESAERHLAGRVCRRRRHGRTFPSLRSDRHDLSPAGHGDGDRRRRRHDGGQRRVRGGPAVHHHELHAHGR